MQARFMEAGATTQGDAVHSAETKCTPHQAKEPWFKGRITCIINPKKHKQRLWRCNQQERSGKSDGRNTLQPETCLKGHPTRPETGGMRKRWHCDTLPHLNHYQKTCIRRRGLLRQIHWCGSQPTPPRFSLDRVVPFMKTREPGNGSHAKLMLIAC